jgi:hypothetical protein
LSAQDIAILGKDSSEVIGEIGLVEEGSAETGPTPFNWKILAEEQQSIVEVKPTNTATSARLDVEDISRGVRRAGASAVAVSEAWLDKVVEEQNRGEDDVAALPVLCIQEELQTASLADLYDRGASGVVMYPDSSSALESLPSIVAAVEEKGMTLVVVAKDDASAEAARAAGVHVVACPNPLADSEDASSVLVGTWDGELKSLMANREAGFKSSLLLDGSGQLKLGTYKWFEAALEQTQKKRSSMIGLENQFWGGQQAQKDVVDQTGLNEEGYDQRNNPGYVNEVESFPGERKKEDGFSREYPTLPDQYIR